MAHTLYHVVIVVLSALIALSLPYTAVFITERFLSLWSLIENEKFFLVCIEICCAISLIMLFNYIGKSWRDRKLAKAAKKAGLLSTPARRNFLSQKRIKRLKEKHGTDKDIMIIGSTGFRTFADPKEDLHELIRKCRKAEIMLLNPFSEGAHVRATSIPDPDITLAHFREQIKKSIQCLKMINDVHKNIRLKLYGDTPLLKLTILGDYIWVQHYHTGLDVKVLPEYVFHHNQNSSGFYSLFYQYFLSRWKQPEIPEYNFDNEELVYKDKTGVILRREKLDNTSSQGIRPDIP